MEDWVLESLKQYVGRSDRKNLGARVAQGLKKQRMGNLLSYRVPRNLPSLGRGLVVASKGVIADYAPVRRVFHVTNAVTKYYYSPFYAERKVPGYHARVAWLDGRQVAFTRDGRYCAFTSDRARDFVPDKLFADNPDLIVCLALAGRGIPYAEPALLNGGEDISCWAIDLLEWNVREPVAPADKYEVIDRYGLDNVEHVGPFEAAETEALELWMKELEADGALGVVLKPSERHHRPLKYSMTAAVLESLPPWAGLDDGDELDPFFERLVQAACAATELDKPADEWDWETVGKALLRPLANAARDVDGGKELTVEHSVWLHDQEAAQELLRQLEERGSSTTIERPSLEPENDGWRLTFERRFDAATAALQRRLSGVSYRD